MAACIKGNLDNIVFTIAIAAVVITFLVINRPNRRQANSPDTDQS